MPAVHIEEGETYVDGKTPETARLLLANAKALGLEAYVVRTTHAGFIVPSEVAEYDETGAAQDDPLPEPEEESVSDTPSEDWSHADLDAYAESHEVHLKAGLNKADKVAALLAAPETEKESD